MTQGDGTFENAVAKLNSDYFFREFTFSSNTFKPDPTTELELADNLVWLDDLMIVYQIKERAPHQRTTRDAERRWFQDHVVKKASRQVRDTLTYLKTYKTIELQNDRGHVFNVATAQAISRHKLVVYHPSTMIPADCILKKSHQSKKAGTIHLIHSSAYLEILKTLVTPVEICEYLAYREALIKRWPHAVETLTEKALVGHYLQNLPDEEPNEEYEVLVDKVMQQDQDWDISHMIHVFPERQNTPNSRLETGYAVLKALASLYRTEMAEFKKRFRFSMKKAFADIPCVPHRFSTSRRSGFVFIPLTSDQLPNRQNILLNITALNKYDQKLDKCVGLTFIADGQGPSCDVQWCPIEFPWYEDSKMQKHLAAHYPFKPVQERRVGRYGIEDAF